MIKAVGFWNITAKQMNWIRNENISNKQHCEKNITLALPFILSYMVLTCLMSNPAKYKIYQKSQRIFFPAFRLFSITFLLSHNIDMGKNCTCEDDFAAGFIFNYKLIYVWVETVLSSLISIDVSNEFVTEGSSIFSSILSGLEFENEFDNLVFLEFQCESEHSSEETLVLMGTTFSTYGWQKSWIFVKNLAQKYIIN